MLLFTGESPIKIIGCLPTRHVQKDHMWPQSHTQLVTPSLPWKRGSPSTIHLPNDSISLIGARASTSDGRPRPSRAQRQKPILSSKQVSDQREGGRQTHETSGTIEKNLDNGHLRNSSRGREGACAVERGINQEEELVASILQPTIGHTSHSNEPPLSAPVSLFSMIPPRAETFICLRTA